MGAISTIQLRMTPAQVEELMGIPAGNLGAVGWLVIQEEANGATRESIAKALHVEVDDVVAMIQVITDSTTEHESIWKSGITVLKTSAMLTQNMIRTGWDTVEAMAIDKLSSNLANMRGNGDAETMLKIATGANRAMRRSMGEQADSRKPDGTRVEFGIELNAGNVGSIKMQLSPRIREQMQQSGRQIDVTPRQGNLGRQEMLGLNATRALLDPKAESSTLDGKNPEFEFDLEADQPEGFGEFLDSIEK